MMCAIGRESTARWQRVDAGEAPDHRALLAVLGHLPAWGVDSV